VRHRSRKGALAAVAAGVVVAALPAAAGGVIVPRRSIAGIALRMTPSAVRAELGEPSSRFRRRWGPSDSTFPAWRYAAKLVIVFVDGEVLFVETRNPGEKTRRGVGPGSSRADLLRAHPRIRCVSARFCEIGSATGVEPKPYTGFWLRRDRVRSVELSVATP
jgi:hypothetical protein